MGRYDGISREALKRMLDQAQAAGHTLSLEHREPPPEHPDAHVKYWAVCSCGYRSTARRALSAALSTLAWHAGQGMADPRPITPTRSPEIPSQQTARL